MSVARDGAAAVAQADGRLLVSGGTGGGVVSATSEALDATGVFAPAATMLQARRDHASIELQDGRVLVAGGTTDSGSATASAEIYDPATMSWSAIGAMAQPRTKGTAILLLDGRALIAGGENAAGALATLELFEPASGTFTTVLASIQPPRTAMAAVLLDDGRVLLTGGSEAGAPSTRTEIYDPAANVLTPGPFLRVPRSGHTATRLQNGDVLVIGGTDGSADLGSVEILRPAALQFARLPAKMITPRCGHTATLLQHNGSVLITGGTSGGVDVLSAERFLPWDGKFSAAGSLSTARPGAVVGPTSLDGVVIVAGGGGTASSDLYVFPTVKTDLTDYVPGDTALITGKGFPASSVVTLQVVQLKPNGAPGTKHKPWLAATGPLGELATSWFVDPADSQGTNLRLSADCAGVHAEHMFTDAGASTDAADSMASISPAPVTYGSTTTFTLIVTNLSSLGTPTIGSVKVAVPAGLTVTGIPSIAAYDTAGTGTPRTWDYDATASTPTLMKFTALGLDANEINSPSGHLDITFTATATSVGSMVFTTTSYSSRTWTSGAFPVLSPTVTVEPAPLTVTANDDSKTYDAAAYAGGNGIGFSGFVLGETQSVLGGSLAYSGSAQGAINAGTHAITPGGFTSENYALGYVSGTLTIHGAPVTVTANNKTKTYGDENPAFDATVVGAVAGGDAVDFTLSTTATQFSGVAGSPYAIAVSLGANPNYTVTPIDGALAIDPKAATVTANNKTKTYGDENPVFDATVAGEVAGGDAVSYTLSTTATQFSGVAASPYAIAVSLGANPNYTVTPVDGALAIDAKAATVTANNKTKTYGDENPVFDATVAGEVAGGDAVSYTLSTTATQFSGVAGSPYAIAVSLGANPNYTVTPVDGALAIDPKAATVTANNKTKTYGDENPVFDATVAGEVAGGDAVSYSLSTTATQFSGVLGSPYAIAVSLGANPNYTVTPIDGALAIDAKAATVTANNKTKTYGDENPVFDATVAGEVAGGDAVSYSLSTTATQFSGVAGSPYAIAVSLGANPNYTVTPIDGALAIDAKAATVTANNKTKTYGDENPVFDATVAGEVAGGDAVSYTLSTTATQFSGVAASPYAIAVSLGANPNYTVTPVDGALAIDAKAATVTANNKTKTYGDENPAFDATVVGEVAGGDAVSYTLSTTATQFSGVLGSPFAIAVSLGSNPNYTVTPIDGALAIDPKAATVTANNKTKTYGDENPVFDATVAGEVAGGDAVSYTLSTTATQFSGVAGSPYSIAVSLGSNPNYTVTPVDGALAIDAKAATVTANNKTKTYGDENPAFDATVVGEVAGGDAVTYTLSTTATQFSAAGSPFAIAVSLGANPNYSVTPIDGILTIDPAQVTVTANNKNKTYGDQNPSFDATVAGEVVGGDAVSFTLSSPATQFSGVLGSPYAITVNLGSNPNYTVTPVDGALAIDPALATVTANNKVKTYGDQNPAFDATVTGEVAGGDAVSYTLSTTATQLSGVAGSPYAIAVNLGANPNYVVTPIDGALTIAAKAATVTAHNKLKTYGNQNPTLDATVVGEVAGGDAVNFTLSTTATQFSSVGNNAYAIEVGVGSNPNYSVTPIDGTMTIDPAQVTVTANNKVKSYGAQNPTLDATVVGAVAGGDVVDFTLSTTATQFSSVASSPFAIAVSLGSNPNYGVTPVDGALTIDPALVTVTANNKVKSYGDANPALDATVVGEVPGGDAVNYTLSTTATQFSGVASSPFAIAVSLGSNPNYNVTPIDGALAIDPALVTVSANNKVKTYGQDNPVFDATVVGEVAGGDAVSYTLSSTATQFSGVLGSPYAIAVSLGSNPNYTVTPIDGALTIDPALATVAANNRLKTFGDQNPAFDATVAGEVAGGDAVSYTLSSTATQFSGVLGSPYAISVNLGANPNYTVTPIDGALTIDPALATVTANNELKTYGDQNPAFDATVVGEVAGGDAVSYTLSSTATQFSGVLGSPYAISVNLGANPNYTVTPIDGALTIAPAVAIVTANNEVKTYGDANPKFDAVVVGEVLGGDAVSYTLSTTATQFSGVAGSPYAIVVNLGSNPNYTVTPIDGALTIGPALVTVSANNKVKSYGQLNPALDATVVGEVAGGDAVNYALSTTATQFSGVASSPFAIAVSLGSNPNYTVTPIDGQLTIGPALVTVSANNKVKTYGQDNPVFDATVVGEVAGGDAVNYTLSTTATQFSGVLGSPYAIAVSLGSNPNYSVTPIDGALTVDPALASVTASNKLKTYGDQNPAFDATVVGEIAGGDAVSYTLSSTATQFSGVLGSPYAIAVNLGSNPNYTVTPIDGALTVDPALATVTANNDVKTYGDPNPAFDAVVVGEIAGGDAVSYTLSSTATQFSGVLGSPYAIAVNLGANPNYTVTPIDGALAIGPKAATVTANNKVKSYGDANPAFDATIVGEVAGGDAVDYTLSTTATQFSSVAGSPYAIAVNLGSNPNYTVTPTDGTLTIAPKAATVTANNKVKSYGDLNPALDATVVGEVAGGDAIDYTLSTTATQFSGVAGSPYAIAVSLGSNPNYSVTLTDGALVIDPKAATVTANNKVKTFGDLNPALDATVVGEVAGGDAINYTLSTTAAQFSSVAGSPYAIAVGLGSNPNYNVTGADGTLTVNPASTSSALSVANASVQYSDLTTFTATLSPAQIGGSAPATGVQFLLNGNPIGGVQTLSASGGNLTASLVVGASDVLPVAPGSYAVTAAFTGGSPDFSVSAPAAAALSVAPEDARAAYTGVNYAATASAVSSTATVLLSATIQDITAVMPGSDPHQGDISNATVTFVDRGTGLAIATVPVSLVNPLDVKTGTASYSWNVDLGAGDGQAFTIGIVVGGHYARNAGEDDTIVTVKKATLQSIGGGGYIVNTTSQGPITGTPGLNTNFGMTVKFNKNLTSIQGKVSVIVRANGVVYQIKGVPLGLMNVVPITGGTAFKFTSSAILTDITDPLNPIPLGSTFLMQTKGVDLGNPGTADKVSFSLTNAQGTLLFASSWNGSSVVEQVLGGGNLEVR